MSALWVIERRSDNVLLLRKGAGAEINSAISRQQASIVVSLPGIATNGASQRLISMEPVVLNNLPKRSNGKPSNVTVRGTRTLAQRVDEIGTLRALGFRRSAVLLAFLLESLLLSLVGGVVGLAAASLMQSVDISTTNFQTFSEMAFQFKLTPTNALQTLVFALLMGFIGGFIPAWRAAQMKIVDCLREA